MFLHSSERGSLSEQKPVVAILGTVGVPGRYGGFETLAENIVRCHDREPRAFDLAVVCSADAYPDRPPLFGGAALRYVPLDANGVQSIPYDVCSLLQSVRRGDRAVILLGVSGALALPLIRLVSRMRIVTNIDGIEWRREKWRGVARFVLRASEWAAVRFSHAVVADNRAIADYVRQSYGRDCPVIAYGGDHAVEIPPGAAPEGLPRPGYALALCRIEPENNVDMILEAFSTLPDRRLVFVGNWDRSAYGRELRTKFAAFPNLTLMDPVYEPAQLRRVREGASVYVHGHSAGGTNPSLIEMMHFGVPVLAFNCLFNRFTTEESARYFSSASELADLDSDLPAEDSAAIGAKMKEIAGRRYTWDVIYRQYSEVLADCAHGLSTLICTDSGYSVAG